MRRARRYIVRESARDETAGRVAPNEIVLDESGEATAVYGGQPLLRYSELKDLLLAFELNERDLIAIAEP